MGKGGGSQPSQTTAYQTNLPEYAKPYVTSMLEATQRQLFNTQPGADGTEITGFRPYSPYSSDPTKYFAGPTGLQQSSYNEAANMQTPGAYGAAQGMAGMSGLGQFGTAQQAGMYGGLGTALGAAGAMQAMPAFGAGQQFASQVTDPNAMAQYMSPYQQNVTDIAKMNAVREAQMAGNQANLGAARQGTYGGARQALAGAERERNLLSNLSNIQAQGSQSAFDKAMQAQQFGANLGLQGIQTGLQGVQAGMQGIGQGLQGVGAQQAGYAGAGQAASTLGQLGGAQQQADLARLGFQQQTGKEQQAYQQNIINQQIQDYATQQQYPFMQLSTMSNLLRGLPMQGMTTQQYQAQPSALQQGIGLLGAGASLYGGINRKEGGTIEEYRGGGGIKASLENKIDDIADAGGARGLQALLAQTKSPQAKEMIMDRMREEGIAAANTGGLMTNMAGGGIIAFENGGDVDPLMQFSGLSDEGRTEDELRRKKIFEGFKDTDYQKAQRMLAQEREAIGRGVRVLNPLDPSTAKAATLGPPTKEQLEAGPPRPPAAAPAVAPVNNNQEIGIAKALAEQNRLYETLGITPGMGEKTRGLMDYIAEGKARRQSEAGQDRYLRMADAFAQFGSTAGPFMTSASKALGGFAKGEAGAQKELRAADFADKKMEADLERAQRAEAKGDFATAQKAYDSYENRQVLREGHLKNAEASMYGADRETRMIDRAMKDPEFLKTTQAMKGNDNVTVQAIKTQLVDINQQLMMPIKDEALKKKLMKQRAALNARLGEIAKVGDTTTAAAQEVKVVSNKAEYDKLKPGQQYRDPNGEIRTKG